VALLVAEAERQIAHAAALSARKDAEDVAATGLRTTQAAAESACEAALDAANAAWSATEASAWEAYEVARSVAEAELLATEESAWQSYTAGMAQLQADLAQAESTILSEFDARVAMASSAWHGSEDEAWTSYVTALTNLPTAPPSEPRRLVPPAVEILAPPVAPPAMLVLGPRADVALLLLLVGQPQPEPEYGTRDFWLTRPRRSARDGGLNISAEQRRDVVQEAIASLDTTFRLETIPVLSPNDPAPRFIEIGSDRAAGWLNGGIATPAQLAHIQLRVNLIHLKQNLVNSLYNMVVNNPPDGQRWTEQDRRNIAIAMNRAADDLIRMVDLFLRTHPGARPSLGSRHWWQDRFSAPWCADWAEAMDAWISTAIVDPRRKHPAARYIEFEWGQYHQEGIIRDDQHNFIIIKPALHRVQLSRPGNAAIDPVILLFDPWRDLLPRVYRPTPLTEGGFFAPTRTWHRNNVDPQWYWDNRSDKRFREPLLGLPLAR
jgi:hypothetical protein